MVSESCSTDGGHQLYIGLMIESQMGQSTDVVVHNRKPQAEESCVIANPGSAATNTHAVTPARIYQSDAKASPPPPVHLEPGTVSSRVGLGVDRRASISPLEWTAKGGLSSSEQGISASAKSLRCPGEMTKDPRRPCQVGQGGGE